MQLFNASLHNKILLPKREATVPDQLAMAPMLGYVIERKENIVTKGKKMLVTGIFFSRLFFFFKTFP